MEQKGEMVAKLKFWFGRELTDLFNEQEYIIEWSEDRFFVTIYKKVV